MNLKDAINLDPPYRHIQTEEERMGGGGEGGIAPRSLMKKPLKLELVYCGSVLFDVCLCCCCFGSYTLKFPPSLD